MPELIAIDWGTSHRRTFLLDGEGAVIAAERSESSLRAWRTGFVEARLADLRARWGDLPLLCAGMIGSTLGWRSVPYLELPVRTADLAAGLVDMGDGRSFVVPGLCDPAGEVMRGEEIQVAGALEAGLAPPDARFCLPGTHTKWALSEGGRVVALATAMTGELFALLREHSVLAEFMRGKVTAGAAFEEGVRAGLAGELMGRLFAVRARPLLGLGEAEDGASFASGLLIGADIAAHPPPPGASVHVVGEAALGRLYACALALAGAVPRLIDGADAFVHGAQAIWRQRP